jgi:hypothetical protein
VQIHPIIDGGPGFTVCFIPSGTDKPYRSAVDNVYYQRVQDGCIAISHSLLRSLFFPRTSPRLRIQAEVKHPSSGLIDLRVRLRNDGTATADQMFMRIVANRLTHLSSLSQELFSQPDFDPRGNALTRLIGRVPLHPGDMIDVIDARWKCSIPDNVELPPRLVIDIFMADQQPVHFDVAVGLDEAMTPGFKLDLAPS